MSALFAEEGLGEAVVVFGGTAAGEWRDDFLGGAATGEEDGVSTAQQRNALEWYRSLKLPGQFVRITVTGHSKGGNKAKYIALMEDSVSRCVSFDGQGFSDEFMQKYQKKISERQQVIENHNMEYDYVNILLNHVGKRVYYQRHQGEDRGFLENHCVNAFFWFGEGNACFLVRSGEGEAKELRELNRFLNCFLRSLPRERKIAAMELLGAMAEVRLGNGEKGKRSRQEEGNYIVSLLLHGENPEIFTYLLAYLLKYQQVEPGLAEAAEGIGQRFGILPVQRLAKIIERFGNGKYSDVLMGGVKSLGEVMPDVFWDMLQGYLEESWGTGISGEDLKKVAVRISKVIRLQSKIRLLLEKGEDLYA